MSDHLETPDSRPQPPPRRHLVRGAAVAAGGVLLAAVLAVVGLTLLFAQGNPALSRGILTAVNNALGTDSSRVVAARISGDLFGAAVLERPRLIVRSADGFVNWAEARRVRVEYDLFQVLFGNRRALRVTLEDPRVQLVHDSRGNLVVPRLGGRPSGGGGRAVTQVEVFFRGGSFSLDRGDVRFGSIAGDLLARVEPERTTVLVRRLYGVSEMQGRPGRVRAEGRAVVTGRAMRVEPLAVALDSTRVTAQVDWDLASARVISSSIRFAPLDLDEAMRLLDLEPVTAGTLRGDLTFAGDPSSGSARVRLSGTVAGEPVDTLSLGATMVPGALRIEDLNARVRGARIQGYGLLETRGVVHADLRLEGVDPAALPWFHGSRETPRGVLGAHVAITARKTRPMPTVEVAADLLPGRLGRLAIERGRVRLAQSSAGAIAIDSAWVDTPGARIEATGSVGPAPDRVLALGLTGAVRDLGAMQALLAPAVPAAGAGRVEASIQGPAKEPSFRARAWLAGTRVKSGLGCDSLAVEARGTLGGHPVVEAELRGRRLFAGEHALGDAQASIGYDGGLAIRRYRQTLGDTTLALTGRVRFAEGEARAVLDSVAFLVGTRAWRNTGDVDASLKGDRLHVSRLRFGLESGSLDLAGDLWLKEARLDIGGSCRSVDLARATAGRDSALALGGIASADFRATGDLGDPVVSAALEVLRPKLGPLSGDSLALALRYEPGRLTVEDARFVSGRGRIGIAGRAEPGLKLEDWIRALSKGDRGWASRVNLALSVAADSLSLEPLASLSPGLRTLSGRGSLRLSLSGTPADPRLEFDGGGAALAYRGVGLEGLSFQGHYAGRRLTLTDMSLRQGKAVSYLHGFVPVDLSLYAPKREVPADSLSLEVRMTESDFSVAALFVQEIASSSGKLTLLADVSGTSGHPRVTGWLKLADGVIRFSGRDEILEGVGVEATIDEERITATKIVAREGKKGTLRGTGWWRWVRGTPLGEYDLEMRAQDFTATDGETYLLRFSGDFSIRNGKTPEGEPLPRITGTAALSRGELTWTPEAEGPETAASRGFLYDVRLDAPRNLWFRNLDTEVELGGSMELKNEGKGDVILGDLDVLQGRYYICYAKFQMQSGTISFHSLDKIDPDVTIDAESTVPSPVQPSGSTQNMIKMALTGHSSQLKITPYDDGGESPNVLWKALCIGQMSSVGLEEAGAASTPPQADMTLPIRDYLFRNVERLLGDVGIIDTIDLKSGQVTTRSAVGGAPTIGAVGVGKYVTPELYLRYSRDFSGTAEQSISAEYRVTRYLLLKGEQVQRPTSTTPKEYNLDLKLRLEY